MKWRFTRFLLVLVAVAGGVQGVDAQSTTRPTQTKLELPTEKHLVNIRQLSFGGENAEAYFSGDGSHLIFQSKRDGRQCDQIYTMRTDGSDVHMVSTGKGKTTCSYYFPGKERILFSSTHGANGECPPPVDYSHGYVWPVYAEFDIYTAKPDGSNLKPLTNTPGYDAEATISTDGKKIVFTSSRDGDLDIYTMDADGKNKRQVTHLNAASFAPYFFPDGRRIIFASNVNDPKGRNFDLYMIKVDGSGLEQITFNETFDGFPMFSPDGKKLAFASNRNGKVKGETNVFIAEWKEE